MNKKKMPEPWRNILKFVLVLGLGSFSLTAQVPPANQPTPVAPADLPPAPPSLPPRASPPPDSIMESKDLPLRFISTGVFELANVTLDKRQRLVSFPAVINMNQGPMEYFLVASYGKVHESVLRTDALPFHIHTAMLLLDVSDASSAALRADAQRPGADGQVKLKGKPSTISDPAKETLPGDKLSIEVSWFINGKETTRRAEELVSNLEQKATLGKGNWVYNGSEFVGGTFQSQVTGSLISLITDPQALINNIAPGHENDDIWAVNTNSLPPVNTPVRVTMKIESSMPKK